MLAVEARELSETKTVKYTVEYALNDIYKKIEDSANKGRFHIKIGCNWRKQFRLNDYMMHKVIQQLELDSYRLTYNPMSGWYGVHWS